MRRHITSFKTAFLVVLTLLGGTVGCSDDSTPTSGQPDVDPPAIASVFGLDSTHVLLTYNESVDVFSGERSANYMIVATAPPTPAIVPAPGDTIMAAAAILVDGDRTLLISTVSGMDTVAYDVVVVGVRDLRGNRITTPARRSFAGSNAADVTPPEIVSTSPSQGAVGAGTMESIIVKFSEPMANTAVHSSFLLTTVSPVQSVPFQVRRTAETTYSFTPVVPLSLFTQYSAVVDERAVDLAGNAVVSTFWLFTTTATGDGVPPRLFSSNPADGATDVAPDVLLRLTFTERIDPSSSNGQGPQIIISPDPGEGLFAWSDGGATYRFEPDTPLPASTQYTVVVPEGSVRDLAGNPNRETWTVQFTTGPFLGTGQFSGMLSGDPQLMQPLDLTGTVVAAPTVPFLAGGDEDVLEVHGTGFAAASGDYAVPRLPDGGYFPTGLLDSNGDNVLDPSAGDAFGTYGVDVSQGDLQPDTVWITGDFVSDINFPLRDPVAIAGTVFYIGGVDQVQLANLPVFVGAFDTATFDTTSGWPQPDYGTGGGTILEAPRYVIGELGEGLQPGTYWVGAFLDINLSLQYEPAIDPAGIFENAGVWLPVTVEEGQDRLAVDIVMLDPGSVAWSGMTSAWRKPEDNVPEGVREYRRFLERVVRALGPREAVTGE